MSRTATGDVITVKPTANVYTAMAAVAFIAELIAFIALYMKFSQIFGGSLFG